MPSGGCGGLRALLSAGYDLNNAKQVLVTKYSQNGAACAEHGMAPQSDDSAFRSEKSISGMSGLFVVLLSVILIR